jgi:hypothetical protein
LPPTSSTSTINHQPSTINHQPSTISLGHEFGHRDIGWIGEHRSDSSSAIAILLFVIVIVIVIVVGK